MDKRKDLAKMIVPERDLARRQLTEGTMTAGGVALDGVGAPVPGVPHLGTKPPVGSRVLVAEVGAGKRYILGVLSNG